MGDAVPGVEIRGGGGSAHNRPHARNLGGGDSSTVEYHIVREDADGRQDLQQRQERGHRVQVRWILLYFATDFIVESTYHAENSNSGGPG